MTPIGAPIVKSAEKFEIDACNLLQIAFSGLTEARLMLHILLEKLFFGD